MKKSVRRTVKLFICFTFLSVASALAADNPWHKLERGGFSVITSPLEIPKEVRRHWIQGSQKTPHIIVWVFSGMVKGFVMTTARLGSGVWDVITFPIAIPSQYGPLMLPEYVFEEWPRREEGVEYKNLGDSTIE